MPQTEKDADAKRSTIVAATQAEAVENARELSPEAGPEINLSIAGDGEVTLQNEIDGIRVRGMTGNISVRLGGSKPAGGGPGTWRACGYLREMPLAEVAERTGVYMVQMPLHPDDHQLVHGYQLTTEDICDDEDAALFNAVLRKPVNPEA